MVLLLSGDVCVCTCYITYHRLHTNSYDDADELALRLYERAAMQSDVHLYGLGDLMLRMEAKGVDTTSGMTCVHTRLSCP